ncbi:hypothetical protein NLX86_15175 [Streptomyces sp. A3M-1-3]|uniref:hypothetical protein n=1 Tax=Streptomyces sp. A3M-1-3 TaxID=2962044 RepID=UPI0020B78C7F|nr:hypothetical protein [Streptomyces sp. A3M-1-3]MCP3819398.1 hypothetical protein [Streptomyces sp. A3M-1-3]
MAHAAPTPGTYQLGGLKTSAWVGPLLFGALYGIWAAFIGRQAGPITGYNVLLGFVSGVLFAGILFLLNRMGPGVLPELRGVAYGTFAAIAMGFMFSLTGETVLMSSGVGVAVGAAVGVIAFYRFHQHEP